MSADDEACDRGVAVERLMPEIAELRDAAQRYGRAVDAGIGAGSAGLDLEATAVRYAQKLDDERRKARQVDYGAIFEAESRRVRESGN